MASSFKVIVVGGGPVGLTAAHALHHAGIDFVVLEARDSVTLDQGASLVLAPPSIRIMHQLGLWEKLSKIGSEMAQTTSFTNNGHRFSDNRAVPRILKTYHGSAPVIFHRAQLVESLYDGLPRHAKASYFLNKKIMSIKVQNPQHGVQVTCTDGSTYEGSMVLGADGVHSKTRTLMRELALSQDPNQVWKDAVDPFPAQYRCLWSSFSRPASVEEGHATDTQSKDMSVMFLAGKERGWIFLYERLPAEKPTAVAQPTKASRMRYTESDMQTFATRFADFPVTEKLRVKDVYGMRLSEGMADLEEGILTHWSWGRIVLAGDACHKFTPNAGRGLNNGIQDVVALCNGLHEILVSSSSSLPDDSALRKVFAEYQNVRANPLQVDYKQSRSLSRLHSWDNMLYYLIARYVMSWEWVIASMLRFLGSRAMKKALVLDYIAADEPFPALIPWEHSMVNKKQS